MASDVRIWTGTAWESIKGPAGPVAVSADAGNCSQIGTDGRIHTPALPLAGGTVTGVAAFQQAVTFQATVSAVGGAAVFVLNNTANAANARRATINVGPNGRLLLATTDDAGTTIQTQLEIDRTGNIQTSGASLGTFPGGNAIPADLIVEDVAIGTKGMRCYGPVILNDSGAFLTVTNAAGQFNLNCVSGAGVTQGQYRIQSQTTGAFRIFDVTAAANRIVWAADGTMTHPGNAVFQGASSTFRQASINSEALGPMNVVPVPGGLTLDATHMGKVLMLAGDAATITLPGGAAIPVGSVVEFIHAAPTYSPVLAAGAGATISFNVRNTYYTGSNVQFSGRLTSVRAIKTSAAEWILFGSLANPTVT